MSTRKLGDGKPPSWLVDISQGGCDGIRCLKRFVIKGAGLASEITLMVQNNRRLYG